MPSRSSQRVGLQGGYLNAQPVGIKKHVVSGANKMDESDAGRLEVSSLLLTYFSRPILYFRSRMIIFYAELFFIALYLRYQIVEQRCWEEHSS